MLQLAKKARLAKHTSAKANFFIFLICLVKLELLIKCVFLSKNVAKIAITAKGEKAPQQYEGDILVPFCIESALSGVQKEVGPH